MYNTTFTDYVFDLTEEFIVNVYSSEDDRPLDEQIRDFFNAEFCELMESASEDIDEDLETAIEIAKDYINCLMEDEEVDVKNEDDVDESTLIKHKISKMQSVIDARMRKTDPKWKLSRKKTLRKREARDNKVVNKKLSRALKKSFRQGFGKRWVENEKDMETEFKNLNDADHEEEMVEPTKVIKKLIKDKAKLNKDAIKESINEAFNNMNFGTLNEDESKALYELVEQEILKAIDIYSDTTCDCLTEYVNTYINEEVIPHYENKAKTYVDNEIIPFITESIDGYLDYVANEISEELSDKQLIVKSLKTEQANRFQDKLLELIETELKIIPNREDALHEAESRYEDAISNLYKERVLKNEYKKQLEEAEKAIYLQKLFMENGTSSASQEYIIECLSEENLTLHKFKKEADKLIIEVHNKETPVTMHNSNNTIDDIIARTINLIKK